MIPALVVRYHQHGDRYPITTVAFGQRDVERLEAQIPEMEADPKILSVEVAR